MSFDQLQMDLKEDIKEYSSESQSSSTSSSNGNNNNNNNSNILKNGEVKKCIDCQTSTTPLWRGGPAGPKTLCNACGIKYHKKRRALLGIVKNKEEKAKKKSNSMFKNDGNAPPIGMPLKIKVMKSGMRQSDKLGEVEQAALLLMALSYGSVYA